MTRKELAALRDICIFLILMYIRAWFRCPSAIAAPKQDLNFIKEAVAYAEIDAAVSAAVLHKMKNHLSYLSRENIMLALFDPNISIEEKEQMVSLMKSKEPVIKLKNDRLLKNPKDLIRHNLCDFVCDKTENFLHRFALPSEFLQRHPSTWETDDNYNEARKFLQNLLVVNDTAERGVRFMKDYNRVLTNDEEEKQLILQIVEAYRAKYPSYNKSSLMF